jgi:hypothetical protein
VFTLNIKEDVMKFSDLFVPRYLHSNPEARIKFVANSTDDNLLEQMAEKDKDAAVRKFAAERAQSLRSSRQTV